LESIRLGGTEQWIRIRGKDTSNPVLLLIQQGPGLPMLNEAVDANKQWHLEDDFVVVYWDQRACGKSFSRAIPPQSMTVEQLITDTHELIQALTQRFNVAQLYVAGFSLGGSIAALVASRHPEHIRAVVCVDLDVHFDVAERVAYDFALQQATRLGNKRAMRELRRIGLPPHLESKTFSTRVKWVTNFGGVNRQATYPRLSLKTLRQLVLSRDYTLSDIVGTLRDMRFAQDQLLPDLANAQRQAAHLVRRVRAHAGGLAHFPKADILLSRTEYQSASGWRGQVRGYLPHHWPAWFAPTLIPFAPAAVGPFPMSYPLTRAEDVLLVPTEGHTPGHLSVIVLEDDHALLLTGDTSYSQRLMLDEAVDGVAPDEQASRQTLRRIHAYTQQVPTVYLPSHDPEARERLFHRQTVLFPETIKAVL
jgi:pimeloyl-ACP methyl ester carboxylesterase